MRIQCPVIAPQICLLPNNHCMSAEAHFQLSYAITHLNQLLLSPWFTGAVASIGNDMELNFGPYLLQGIGSCGLHWHETYTHNRERDTVLTGQTTSYLNEYELVDDKS